jgi:hypothetical protein
MTQSTFRWIERDMKGQKTATSRERRNDNQSGETRVEGVDGNNQHGAASPLLVSEDGIEVSQPDLTALWKRRAHDGFPWSAVG